ncbi:uncharacterized protein LOC100858183 isoform X5 [Gallus gallus]|uniref:uncharacterized protein LOC100858183 isoform X5 n=1 Tax=Gallus gallus TaxID=9031 RepID=UPI001AE9002E|nr:uncharacterized protein LOC100858183 isoform X5 [Gallus gallus]
MQGKVEMEAGHVAAPLFLPACLADGHSHKDGTGAGLMPILSPLAGFHDAIQISAGTGPIDCSSPFNTRAWKLLADEQPDGLLGTDRTRPPQPPPSNPCLLLDKAQSEA